MIVGSGWGVILVVAVIVLVVVAGLMAAVVEAVAVLVLVVVAVIVRMVVAVAAAGVRTDTLPQKAAKVAKQAALPFPQTVTPTLKVSRPSSVNI